MSKKKYNHAFTVAFSCNSNDPEGATEAELLDALLMRWMDLKNREDEIVEAVGIPFDTYENQE